MRVAFALAHPPYNLREATLRTLADGGLAAIEIDGCALNARLRVRWHGWAAALGLIPVAGSDFHAPGPGPRWVGAVTTATDALERLRARRPVASSGMATSENR